MVFLFCDKFFRRLLLAIVFLLPIHTTYIFSFSPESSQYTRIAFSLLDFCILSAFIVSIPLILQKRITFFLPRYILVPFLFFVLSVFASFFFAAHTDIALLSLAHVCEGAALFLIFATGYVPKEKIALALTAAGLLQTFFAVQQFFGQEIFANSWFGIAAHSAMTLGDSVVEGSGFRILRAYGSFPHPNMLGAFQGVSFLCGLYLYSTAIIRRQRIVLFISSMLILFGLLITFSRGAWFALFFCSVSAALAVALIPRFRQRISANYMFFFLAGVLAAVSIFTFVYWQPVSVRLGLQGNARLETLSFEERTSYLANAFALIGTHPFGVGIGQYVPFFIDRDADRGLRAPMYTYQPVHSHFVLLFTELGFFGFIFFLGFIFSLVLYVLKQGDWSSVAVMAFLFVAGLFDHYFWTFQSGMLLWWVASSFSIQSRIFQDPVPLTKSN